MVIVQYRDTDDGELRELGQEKGWKGLFPIARAPLQLDTIPLAMPSADDIGAGTWEVEFCSDEDCSRDISMFVPKGMCIIVQFKETRRALYEVQHGAGVRVGWW